MTRYPCRAALAALAIAAVLPVHAQALTSVPPGGMPSANEFSAQILPERAGIVSWRTLAQVSPVKQGNRMVPEFGKDILALDRKDTKVQGFMIPLDVGDKQKRFLLTAVPSHCSFCLPAGPDSLVEVVAKTPVKFTFEPIVVAGKFAVLKDDSAGLLYRLTDASQVEVAQLAPDAPAGLLPGTGLRSRQGAGTVVPVRYRFGTRSPMTTAARARMTAQSTVPLLLLPGLTNDGGVWEGVMRALPEGFDASVGDVSTRDSMSALAADVLAKAPARFAVAGLSMGGYCALEILRQAPERVRGLALVDSSARPDTPESRKHREAQIERARSGYAALIDEAIPKWVHPSHLGDAKIGGVARAMALAAGPEVFIRQQRAIMSRADSRPLLPKIDCPTRRRVRPRRCADPDGCP